MCPCPVPVPIRCRPPSSLLMRHRHSSCRICQAGGQQHVLDSSSSRAQSRTCLFGATLRWITKSWQSQKMFT
eukprot:3083203-Alexandrium_andersonii.AAC.1